MIHSEHSSTKDQRVVLLKALHTNTFLFSKIHGILISISRMLFVGLIHTFWYNILQAYKICHYLIYALNKFSRHFYLHCNIKKKLKLLIYIYYVKTRGPWWPLYRSPVLIRPRFGDLVFNKVNIVNQVKIV